jgi:hypothetical protein
MATVLQCITEEQRFVVLFLWAKGFNAMFPVYGGKCLSHKVVAPETWQTFRKNLTLLGSEPLHVDTNLSVSKPITRRYIMTITDRWVTNVIESGSRQHTDSSAQASAHTQNIHPGRDTRS